MNKKQPEITMKTKQAIKVAFWSIYKEKKIDKITVKDITTKAGYNRTTFYAYFSDVYDVLNQIEEELMPGIDHLPPNFQPDNQSIDFISSMISIYELNSDYYSVLLGENGDPSFSIKMKNAFKSMVKERLKEKKDFPAEEIDYALEFLISGTVAIIKYWYDNDKRMSMESLIPLMENLMDNRLVQKLNL